jgi:hypothetical protein
VGKLLEAIKNDLFSAENTSVFQVLERLVNKPSFAEPTCSITSKARLTSSAGPAITPSSKNQRFISSAQLSEIALITFLRTIQKRTGARGLLAVLLWHF